MKRYKKNIIKSTLIGQFFLQIRLNAFKRKWIRDNKHNQTIPVNIFDATTVEVGDNSYGELNIVSFSNKTKLRIGSYVSIAQNVHFILDAEHYLDHLSTYPFKAKITGTDNAEAFSKGDIVIEDDVWIGFGATIISGVKVGKGAVIAAGSLVTSDVAPYTIVGGVPAKTIRKRFTESIIDKLCEFEFENLSNLKVNRSIDVLYSQVTEENVDDIIISLS